MLELRYYLASDSGCAVENGSPASIRPAAKAPVALARLEQGNLSTVKGVGEDGVVSGSTFSYATVPVGAAYSSFEVEYNPANALADEKFFFNTVASEGGANDEEDLDSAGRVARIVLTGVQD